jgi:hypothetical protein
MKRLGYSKNREAIYGLLTRAKRYHASMTASLDMEVGALCEAIAAARAAGREVGFLACLVKATSIVMRKHPRLNHHLFHGTFGGKTEVDFEEVSCNLVMLREADDGEKILLPLVLRRSDEMAVDAIHAEIRRHRERPLAELPAFQAVERVKKLPRLALRLFSWKCRSDPAFYLKYFGTYGLSPLILEDAAGQPRESVLGTGGHSVFNTGCAFFPFAVGDRGGQKTMSVTIGVDHYLVDGHDMFAGAHTLRLLLARPARLLGATSDGVAQLHSEP